MKAYESLESYNQFVSGWVKEVKTKLFLNYLLKLPWLLERSVCNVFPSWFYCSILIRCIVFITSSTISGVRESICFSNLILTLYEKTDKGEAESIILILTLVFSSFLSVKSFLKIIANHFFLLTFESFKPFLLLF